MRGVARAVSKGIGRGIGRGVWAGVGAGTNFTFNFKSQVTTKYIWYNHLKSDCCETFFFFWQGAGRGGGLVVLTEEAGKAVGRGVKQMLVYYGDEMVLGSISGAFLADVDGDVRKAAV